MISSNSKQETIAAIATAHGIGSISIVRVSGDEALSIAKKLTKKENIKERYATLCTLYDSKNEIIDEAIVIYFKAPKSFTGEDIVEFQSHGGTVVANLILNEVIRLGARLANPGEFSKRAFLNGKIDLTKAEAIAKLIETKSVDAAKILSRQIKGELKEYMESLRDSLVEILAYVEVNIDYAEEDLPTDLQQQIEERLNKIIKELKKTLQISKQREGLLEGFKVSIVGKPNVGKSSLLNSLLNYNRAIISDIAGTTRDTIEEEIRIGTHLIKIVDTAGIRGETSDTIEKIGIERSMEAIKESDIVLAVFDASNPFNEDDEKILNLLKEYRDEKKIIVILNKIDLPLKFDTSKIEEFEFIKISCKKDTSIVIEKLKEYLDGQTLQNDVILVSKRQIEAISNALKEMELSKERLNEGELELFAYHINDAISFISSVTRPFERDEILDKMFGSFCLGK